MHCTNEGSHIMETDMNRVSGVLGFVDVSSSPPQAPPSIQGRAIGVLLTTVGGRGVMAVVVRGVVRVVVGLW